jgi:tetratricopeptide (TPR) repeat protein
VKELKYKLEKGELDDNLKRYADATLTSLDETFKAYEGCIYYFYARILLDLDELDTALKYFENARKISEELNDRREVLVDEGFIRRTIALKNDEYEFDELMREVDEWIVVIDTSTYSHITSEYVISRAVKGKFNEDDRKRLESLIPRHKRITLPMLSLFGIMPRDTKLLEEFEVEEAYPRLREYLVMVLGLLPEFAEEMDYEYAKLKVGKDLNETDFLKFAKEIILKEPPVNSMQAFARILRLYMDGKIGEVVEIAENEAKESSKLPSRLFRELADALRDELRKQNAKDNVRKTFVKLFYLHI